MPYKKYADLGSLTSFRSIYTYLGCYGEHHYRNETKELNTGLSEPDRGS